MTLAQDEKARADLAAMLFQCFDGLRLYGKEPEQLENTVALFGFVLADYPMEKIRSAFVAYLKRNTEIPTPADIVQIIERGGKPPLDKATYIGLLDKRKRTAWRDGPASWQRGDALTTEEEQYVNDYERWMMGIEKSWDSAADKTKI